jgi:adenine/guanine phosphoribosyltransferase-like PRPP-binding protein/uncharacterized HAD superfamily protein
MILRDECIGKFGRQLEICNGTADLTLNETNKYRAAWGLAPIPAVEWAGKKIEKPERKPKAAVHSEKVGSALAKLVDDLSSIKSGSGCSCELLSSKMNEWGISGCEANREYIVGELVKNSEILGVSLAKAAVSYVSGAGIVETTGTAARLVVDWWKGNDVEQAARIAGANWLLTKAIEDVQKKKRERCRIVSRNSIAFGSPFTIGSDKPRFITLEQYAKDVRKLLTLVPHDVDCVAGVARSGLYPASMVAMWLHKPMIIVSQSSGKIVEAGNGWRLGNGHRHVTPSTGRVLVVDDTVMTGGSQAIIRGVIGKQFADVAYATVYCNPAANLGKPDIHAVDLQWPHLLEWNLFNSVISASTAVDFDGILCNDCSPEKDDDGPRYLDFIQNAKPLYLPRKEPLPLIVTARIEKYREPTEAWLKRHGVRWKKLIMHPEKSTRERERTDVAAYKAEHFERWAKTHTPSPGPVMFIESEHGQAREIARISRRMVVCPSTATVWS